MKLLSRFIWLIAGILLLVFAGITLFQIKADKEFELIKNSIKAEYDVQVDKMVTPDPYSIGFASYMSDLKNASATPLFLSGLQPDLFLIEEYLFDDILKYHDVDAVWFFKPDGSLFHSKTINQLSDQQMPIPQEELNNTFKTNATLPFYSYQGNQTIYYHGAKIPGYSGDAGFLIMASAMDKRWIDKYSSDINNSSISIVQNRSQLTEIDKKIIRIERELLAYNGETEAILNVELHLPFLTLWEKTNSNDKIIMTASLILVVLFLIVFLVFWVISPLKRISNSLSKGTSDEIKPLIKGTTEMNEVARMIADYHRKTDELEASESIKRHIIEQAQVGIIIAETENGIINTTNPYACELFKAPEDAVLGNVCSNFMEQSVQSNITEGFESLIYNTKGEEIPVLRTTTKMMMDGKPVIMETFVDLSEIKSLQDKLEEEKKKLSLAVQNSGLIFCEYDFKTDEIILNNNWMFLTKGDKPTIGENIYHNIYESDKKIVAGKIESLEKGAKDTLVAEFRVNHPNRGIIWLSVSVLITKRDENHHPKQLIGLIEDITERINVQQELIKAKEKAEESDRMKSSYLGNMSHKIRTPLNTIVGFANLLSEEELEAEQKNSFINIIRTDTEQVLRLIDDMINLAKIDANQLDINKKNCSINKTIHNLAEYFKANDKTQEIKFSVNTMLPDGKDLLNTDPDQLQKALNNLLSNAFKFTHQGEIELGYFINPVDNKIILYVKDTGIGIPEESKPKIFNRFYQVNPLSEGTGLGLTITQSIVSLLGGKITFESDKAKGSKFFIELPFE